MNLNNEQRAGLYFTIIFHLVVIIILLAVQLGFALQKENSFVLDYSKQEEREKIQREELFKEDIERRIEELLAASEAGSIPLRNVTVDRGSLKDDRGTDAEELYKEAERLQQELDNGKPLDKSEEEFVDYQPEKAAEKKKPESTYSGPSVLNWTLEGRKASSLKIPAYRCMGAGMVTVTITVSPQGTVINAQIQDEISSKDQCLRDFAIRAARLSKFNADSKAPVKQVGTIIYQFIAQ